MVPVLPTNESPVNIMIARRVAGDSSSRNTYSSPEKDDVEEPLEAQHQRMMCCGIRQERMMCCRRHFLYTPRALVVFILVVCLLVVLLLDTSVFSAKTNHHSSTSLDASQTLRKKKGDAVAAASLPILTCPDNTPAPAAAIDTRHSTEWYQKGLNVPEFLQKFREREFDKWGVTYDTVKKGMYEWKAKHYKELLNDSNKDGSRTKKVYESACGIGLNLFMTLEILMESYGASVDHVVVYGNEYLAESTLIARQITSHESFPGRLGTICQGDSSNLSFVPSNTFDLVYSGYISPVVDPLRLADKFRIASEQELFGKYLEYCNSTDRQTSDEAQRIQEEWYAQWVGEMVRIAAPGAKIVVEQVSYSLCQDPTDWGGVSQSSWKEAIQKYNWDVDPDSIEFQDEHVFGNRYNLVMQKFKR